MASVYGETISKNILNFSTYKLHKNWKCTSLEIKFSYVKDFFTTTVSPRLIFFERCK